MRLLDKLTDLDVSAYRIMKILGQDNGHYTALRKKLKGEVATDFSFLQKVCEGVNQFKGTNLKPEDFEYEVVRVRLK